MTTGKSTFWANTLLDLICGASAYSAPANSYVALYTVTPTAADASGTEASSGSYGRATNTNNGTTWTASSSGLKKNGVAFTFTTATGDWSSGSNMVAAALYDSLTTGHELYWGALTENKPVLNGDTASFAINAIQIQET